MILFCFRLPGVLFGSLSRNAVYLLSPRLCFVKRDLSVYRDDWGRGGLVVNTSDSGSRGPGFKPHSGRCVVSLSKSYAPPKSSGNTQEAVAPAQYD